MIPKLSWTIGAIMVMVLSITIVTGVPQSHDSGNQCQWQNVGCDPTTNSKNSLIAIALDVRLVAHQMANKFAIKNKSVSQVFQLIVTHIDQIVVEIRRASSATFKLMITHFQTELSGIQIKLDDDLDKFSPEDSLKHIAEEMAAKLVKLNTTNQKWITKLNGENRTTIASQFELVQVELDSMAEALVNYTVNYTLRYTQVKATLLVYLKEIDSIEIRINDLLYKYNLQVYVSGSFDKANGTWAPYTKQWLHSRTVALKVLAEEFLETYGNQTRFKQRFTNEIHDIDSLLKKINTTYQFTVVIGKDLNYKVDWIQDSLLNAIRDVGQNRTQHYEKLVKQALYDEANRIGLIAKSMVDKFKSSNPPVATIFQMVLDQLHLIVDDVNQTESIIKELVEHFRNEIDLIELKTEKLREQYDREDTVIGIKEKLIKKTEQLKQICVDSIKKCQLSNRTILVSEFELIEVEVDTLAEGVQQADIKQVLLVYRKEAQHLEQNLIELLKKLKTVDESNVSIDASDPFDETNGTAPYTREWLKARSFGLALLAQKFLNKYGKEHRFQVLFKGELDDAEKLEKNINQTHEITAKIGKDFNEHIDEIEESLLGLVGKVGQDPKVHYRQLAKQALNNVADHIGSIAKSMVDQFQSKDKSVATVFQVVLDQLETIKLEITQTESSLVKELVEHFRNQIELIGLETQKLREQYDRDNTLVGIKENLVKRAKQMKQTCLDSIKKAKQSNQTTLASEFELIELEAETLEKGIEQANIKVVLMAYRNEADKLEQKLNELIKQLKTSKPNEFYVNIRESTEKAEILIMNFNKENKNSTPQELLIEIVTESQQIAQTMVDKFANSDKAISKVFELVVDSIKVMIQDIKELDPATFAKLSGHYRKEIQNIQLMINRYIDQYSPEDSLTNLAHQLKVKISELNETSQNWVDKLIATNRSTIASQFQFLQAELDSMVDIFQNYTIDYSLKYFESKQILKALEKEINQIEIQLKDLLYKYNLKLLVNLEQNEIVSKKLLEKSLVRLYNEANRHAMPFLKDEIDVIFNKFDAIMTEIARLNNEIQDINDQQFVVDNQKYVERVESVESRLLNLIQRFASKPYYRNEDKLTLIRRLMQFDQKAMAELNQTNNMTRKQQFQTIVDESEQMMEFVLQMMINEDMVHLLMSIFKPAVDKIELQLKQLLDSDKVILMNNKRNLSRKVVEDKLTTLRNRAEHIVGQFQADTNEKKGVEENGSTSIKSEFIDYLQRLESAQNQIINRFSMAEEYPQSINSIILDAYQSELDFLIQKQQNESQSSSIGSTIKRHYHKLLAISNSVQSWFQSKVMRLIH